MKVLALVPSKKGYSPGQRGSIELWESVLADEGISLDYAPFETEKLRTILHESGRHVSKAVEMFRAYAARLELLDRVEDYDAVFLYREAALLGPAYLEKKIAKKKPIIYQLDDPLFVPYRSPSNGLFSYFKFFSKVKKIIGMSKVVIVNSTQIRQYAEQFNTNIWQIPSIVDASTFTYKPFPANPERVCVGWSGSPTTVRNIKLVEGPLRELSEKDVCDIHLIGGETFDLHGVRYMAQKWARATEVEDLRKMQIGLVPLPNNAWNPYKFIMKTAQYLALGIVPVGTPMASNPEVITHGVTGFLASTDAEWTEYLTLLVKDHKLRNEMSERGAREAREKYDLESNRSKIIAAFRAALN